MIERWAVLGAMGVFFVLALVLPLLRLWRRTGVFGLVVYRGTDRVQRLIGVAMSLFFAAMLGWGVATAALDPALLWIWPAPGWLRAIGWVGMALGVGLLITAQAQMGASWRIGIDQKKTDLVTGGLYALVRNPIYAALLVMLLGLVGVTPSPWTVAGFLFAVIGVGIQTRLEERHLIALHGEQYLSYAAKVGRFVPGVGRLKA